MVDIGADVPHPPVPFGAHGGRASLPQFNVAGPEAVLSGSCNNFCALEALIWDVSHLFERTNRAVAHIRDDERYKRGQWDIKVAIRQHRRYH